LQVISLQMALPNSQVTTRYVLRHEMFGRVISTSL
jgi:hypothetical protein